MQSMISRINVLLSVPIAGCLAACGSENPVLAREVYEIRSVNGRLPATISADAGGSVDVVSGQIVLDARGSSEGRMLLRISRSGQTRDSLVVSSGTYRRENGRVVLKSPDGNERELVAAGDSLHEISSLGHRVLYVRTR